MHIAIGIDTTITGITTNPSSIERTANHMKYSSLLLPLGLLSLTGCIIDTTPPRPATTTTYVAPPPATTYVAPPPTTTYVAPPGSTTTTTVRTPY
jgi:hypothetical protein